MKAFSGQRSKWQDVCILHLGRHMDVSENRGFYPQILHFEYGFSIINHPFWGTLNFWKHPYHVCICSHVMEENPLRGKVDNHPEKNGLTL